MRVKSRKLGLSLLELLAVIGIIVVIAGLLIPAIQAARESSRTMSCQNNLHQLSLAVLSFESRHKYFPRHRGRLAGLVHWHFEVLPDLEQSSLHSQVHTEIAGGMNWDNLTGLRTNITAFKCVSDPSREYFAVHHVMGYTMAVTNYPGIVGQTRISNDGIFPSEYGGWDTKRVVAARDVLDGLSNTLALCERPIANQALVGAWQSSQDYGSEAIALFDGFLDMSAGAPGYPDCTKVKFGPGSSREPCDQYHPWSFHRSGANFARADGSVTFLAYATDELVLRAMSSRAGGETVAKQE